MIKKIGSTVIQSKHRASCHCGSVVLELDLPHSRFRTFRRMMA